jgi:hypothetical protein
MAAAMLHLIDNAPLARELGNQAKRTISDRFSLDRMVSATESLYDSLLSRKQWRAA